ncbi:MAG TPA: 30S ribosomal protein S8 [Candidatus Omnitrophica bacterium]|nr:MAG: 30S ribosomal protein S8 [Candidatus Omnitrophota bacterium]RKY42730.1 MAG: 30S ribosomal protein S8 [Candidatus Omnitrophota bacterium]HEC69081.1 30S ribosomal protein S8 [Candidatus Omnitrophota bacterium]
MSRQDLIADNLISLKNASLVGREEVVVLFSNLFLRICEVLKREGYIKNFREMEEGKKKFVKVYLAYKGKKPLISEVKRVSKPSLRVYVKKDKIPQVLKGKGLALISTSEGVLTDKEARAKGLGGEVVCFIW